MDKLYIVIPAYNEEANIESVIHEWYPIVEKVGNGSKLFVIDDGSKDKTYDILQEAANDYEHLLPVTKPNSGHGATILYGYHQGIAAGADYIFQTDSDGQTRPEEFWDFWARRQEWDMVIGHRKGRQDGLSRILVTRVLKIVLKLCFRVNLKDANTPFRLMRADILNQYIDLIPDNYNLTNVLISVIYAKYKLKVNYLSITFRPRQGGTNSINMKKIFKIGKQAWKDFKEIDEALKK